MKNLLSLLMCFVFLQAQTFALRGGPGGASSFAGAYSGVITETGGGSDIGLFLLTATTNGASNGQVVFFSQSNNGAFFYTGKLTGLTPPGRNSYVGVFSSVSSATGSVISLLTVTRTIAGQIKLQTTPSTTRNVTQAVTGTASARTVVGGSVGPLKAYTVEGWQSSGDSVANGFVSIDNP